MSPQPKTGAPLSSEDGVLLVAGDVLRDNMDGSLWRFDMLGSSGLVFVSRGSEMIRIEPDSFTFIGRPDADGWIPAPEGGWGENPVPGMVVDTKFRDGYQVDGQFSDRWIWSHGAQPGKRSDGSDDIIAIRLPDHISEVREKVEPANGEVAAAVERISAALYRAEEIGTERVLFGRQGPGIVLDDLRTILTALRAQPNGGAK